MKVPAIIRTCLLRMNPVCLPRLTDSSRRNLRDLPSGSEAHLAGLDLPADARRRLLELGFLPGTSLRAVRRAPLGDPIQVEVRGYHLSLRNREASGIRINLP